MFIVSSKKHEKVINKLGITFKNVDIQTLQLKIQKLYDEICDSMKIHRIKINI